MLNSDIISASFLKTFKSILNHIMHVRSLGRDATFSFQMALYKTKGIIIKVSLEFAHFPAPLCLEKIYFKLIQQDY